MRVLKKKKNVFDDENSGGSTKSSKRRPKTKKPTPSPTPLLNNNNNKNVCKDDEILHPATCQSAAPCNGKCHTIVEREEIISDPPTSGVCPQDSYCIEEVINNDNSSSDNNNNNKIEYVGCFGADEGGKDGVLYDAVRSYVSQDCANNEECDIGQTYGWPMNSWCVDNVKDMSHLFEMMYTFNEDINGWNTSSVTSIMRRMFALASSFNRDLSNLDTSSVRNMDYMLFYASSFNGDVSNFDTSKVTNMNSMFSGASSFNGDVSNFDTSSVINMNGMFDGATSFNGDVSNFDISSVTRMSSMFWDATSFNQDLCAWRDSFPYSVFNDNVFADSGCTYQDTPNEVQKGPFCASTCQ